MPSVSPPAHLPHSVDALIVGAGHNGLVAAAYLARAGHSVTVVERRDELHQRIHVAANYAIARFHALNGRNGKPREFSDLPLIEPKERPRGTKLRRAYHASHIISCIKNTISSV